MTYINTFCIVASDAVSTRRHEMQQLVIESQTAESLRVCGGCFACCKVMAIFDEGFEKDEGVWCKHCDKKGGKKCSIYHTRPIGCAKFKCQWLMGYGKEGDRPDLTKIVIDYCDVPIFGKTVLLFELTEYTLKDTAVEKIRDQHLRNGSPVGYIPLRGKKTFFVPPQLQKKLTIDVLRTFAEADTTVCVAGFI